MLSDLIPQQEEIELGGEMLREHKYEQNILVR